MSATGDGERGSTLLEALVVMAVTAMIVGLVFPAVAQGVSAAAFDEAAIGLGADLGMARAQALRTGAEVDIVVDDDGRSYGWSPGPSRALVGGLSLEPAGVAVRFLPDGSSPGGDLQLHGPHGGAAFRVDADTGAPLRPERRAS